MGDETKTAREDHRSSGLEAATHDNATGVIFARPEYAALADEFGFLAARFGHQIAPQLRRDIARLASSIERIDRRIDEASDDDERRRRWADVVATLDAHVGDSDSNPKGTRLRGWDQENEAPLELLRAAEDLRDLAIEYAVLARVKRIVRDEARTSEAIRSATTMRAFVRVVEREGRLTAALALAIAGRHVARDFRRFFFRLAAPANLVDKLLDARADHACGEIAIRPDLKFYAALGFALLGRSAKLALTCMRPVLVARLALRYLGPSRARATPPPAREGVARGNRTFHRDRT